MCNFSSHADIRDQVEELLELEVRQHCCTISNVYVVCKHTQTVVWPPWFCLPAD